MILGRNLGMQFGGNQHVGLRALFSSHLDTRVLEKRMSIDLRLFLGKELQGGLWASLRSPVMSRSMLRAIRLSIRDAMKGEVLRSLTWARGESEEVK